MNALDMVMQRQVPARPAGKTGDGVSPADDEAGKQAFSDILKGKNRAEENGSSDAVAESADASTPPTEAEVLEAALDPDSGQSEEMAALLAALMSSASYPDRAKVDPDAREAGEVDAELAEDDGGLLAEDIDVEVKAPVEADIIDQPADRGASGGAVATERLTNNGPGHAALALTQVAAAASGGRAGPGSQAALKDQSQSTAEGVFSEQKETLRALGLGEEASGNRSGSRRSGADEGLSGALRGNAAAIERDKDQAGPRFGDVDVIESRRFMPPQSMSANAQTLVSSLMDARDQVQAAHRAGPLGSAAALGLNQPGQMLHTLKLQLHPLSLGSVTAVLKLSGEQLSVDLQVETAEAYRQLNDDNQSILKSLRSQGFAVEHITIQHIAAPDRSGNQSAAQGFQGGNPAAANGGDAQSSASRENSGNGGNRQGANHNAGAQGGDQTPYSGSGSRRTDGVYL